VHYCFSHPSTADDFRGPVFTKYKDRGFDLHFWKKVAKKGWFMFFLPIFLSFLLNFSHFLDLGFYHVLERIVSRFCLYFLKQGYLRLLVLSCCNIREISDILPSYLNMLNILIPNKTSI
jgi:hypothetical protein